MENKSQMVKAFLPLVLIFGLRKLPLDEGQTLIFARAVFLVRVAVTAAVVALTALRVRSMAEAEKKKIVKAHEKNMGMGQTEMVPEKTAEMYDRDALIDFTKQQLIQIALITVMHWKFELVQPLILSSVLGLIAFPDTPVFQVHLLNQTLVRPFPHKAPNGLMGLFGADGPATPATPAPAPAAEKKKDK